jgi:heat shock protein HslJ
MKTLKTFILTMIALCAIFLFVGCESTDNVAPETDSVVTEVTPAVKEDAVETEVKEDTSKKEDKVVAPKVSLISVTTETLTGGWNLYTMEDADGEYPISCNVTMSFNFGEETEIFGCAGINNYHGICSIDNQTITFGPIAVTKMAGLPEDMATEDNFLRILGDINQIGFSNNAEGYEELVLVNANTGSMLCFIR